MMKCLDKECDCYDETYDMNCKANEDLCEKCCGERYSGERRKRYKIEVRIHDCHEDETRALSAEMDYADGETIERNSVQHVVDAILDSLLGPRKIEPCPVCKGKGEINACSKEEPDIIDCPECNGKGHIT
jgi:DnaJ-class molecular chaperone